ncbi:hypothetical protein KSP35_16990 [Aquihabitans sp. G128]|uniref:hypothetical protein n=1 Tax=Aquihabitans sp. G128 TaxID=2849779 RepID=UPI001C25054C|nr:hypothetical protein [Aquihabitans sp. G128]QXC60047.1 hypothetical protein KSP35_16990 [Aquihabitans sp. G128]
MDRTATEPEHDRRQDDGLVLDVEAGRLQLGAEAVDLPDGASNRTVLEAYVVLVERCRGDRPSAQAEVRDVDLGALADALDLDAADLAASIEAVLGADAAGARRLLDRLRDHRLVSGLAAVALTATLAGTVLTAGVGPSAPSAQRLPPVRAVAATALAPAASVDAPVGEPITTTPEGVGLVEARTEEADGVGLVPAASVDQVPSEADPATATTPGS